jgi:hypothetical protein
MTYDFYVYQLRLENSETPFYIGKGRGRRILEHFRPSALKKRNHKNNAINKAVRDGVEVFSEVLFDGLTEDQAHAKEVELIAFYGRRVNGGCLTNATDGGEGVSGYKPSEETRRKISAAKRGKKHSDDHRRKMSIALTGRKMSAESIEKTASANRGRKRTPEHIANLSKATRGVKRSDATRAAMSAQRAGKPKSHEHAESMMFGLWDRNSAWKIADQVYDEWIGNGKPGRIILKRLFPDLSIETIAKKIIGGWNPKTDESWLKYASKELENVGV